MWRIKIVPYDKYTHKNVQPVTIDGLYEYKLQS